MLTFKNLLFSYVATILFYSANAGNMPGAEIYNLIINPGFENPLSEGWGPILDKDNASINKDKKNNGLKSLQLSNSPGGRMQIINGGFAVGATYTLLASGMLSDGTLGASYIGVFCKNASNEKTGSFQAKNFTVSKEFEQQYVSFTIPANTTSMEVYAYYEGGKGTFFLDDFILAQGEAEEETTNASSNLINNDGFEKAITNGWGSWIDSENNSISSTVKYSGKSSLQLTGPNAGGRGQVIKSGFKAGEAYILSGWGMLSDGTLSTSTIGVFCKDANNKITGSFEAKKFTDSTAFEKKIVSFVVPENSTIIEVYAYYQGGSGTFYIDDFSLVADKEATMEVTPASGNLIKNDGFERDISNGWASWLDSENGKVSTLVTHSGAGSLKLSGTKAGGRLQVIKNGFKAGGVYTLSAWGTLRDSTRGACYIGVFCKGADNKNIKGFQAKNFTNSTAFEKQSVTFAVPENTINIEVYAYYEGGNGIVFIDDISLIEYKEAVAETTEAPVNLIKNDGFEKDITSGWGSWWDSENTSIISMVKYSGKNSLQLVGPKAGGRAQLINGAFTIGNSYILSAWGMLTESGSYSANIGVLCKDANKQKTGSFESKNFTSINTFELKVITFTVPPNTTSMEVYVYYSGGKATFYADDFSLLENK